MSSGLRHFSSVFPVLWGMICKEKPEELKSLYFFFLIYMTFIFCYFVDHMFFIEDIIRLKTEGTTERDKEVGKCIIYRSASKISGYCTIAGK